MALKRRVEVLFAPEQYLKLEKAAQAQGESVGALIRRAVQREYLQPRAEERQRFVEELLRLHIPVGAWDQVKSDLLEARGGSFETA